MLEIYAAFEQQPLLSGLWEIGGKKEIGNRKEKAQGMILCEQGVMARKTRERKNPLHLFSPSYFSFLSLFPQK